MKTTFFSCKLFIILAALFNFNFLYAGEPDFNSSNPYEILGVSPDASPEELMKAKNQWIKKLHPDRKYHPGTKTPLTVDEVKQNKQNLDKVLSAHNAIANGSAASFTNYNAETESHGYTDSQTGTDVAHREDRLFYEPIRAAYVNELGTILEVGLGKYYWRPKDSNVFNRLYLQDVRSSLFRDERTHEMVASLYDPSLPTGTAPFLIRNNKLHIGNSMEFNLVSSSGSKEIEVSQDVAREGYKVFEPFKAGSELNLWTYSIFKADGVYYVLANTHGGIFVDDRDSSYRNKNAYKLFIGNEAEMQEFAVEYNATEKKLNVIDRDLQLYADGVDKKTPIFDIHAGLFMGYIGQPYSYKPLEVLTKNGEVILEVPAVSESEARELSMFRLLGDLAMLPLGVQTPVTSLPKAGFISPLVTRLFGAPLQSKSDVKRIRQQDTSGADKSIDPFGSSNTSKESSSGKKLSSQKLREWSTYPKSENEYVIAEIFSRKSAKDAALELSYIMEKKSESFVKTFISFVTGENLSAEEFKLIAPAVAKAIEVSRDKASTAIGVQTLFDQYVSSYKEEFYLKLLENFFKRKLNLEQNYNDIEAILKKRNLKWYNEVFVPRIKHGNAASQCRRGLFDA